MEFFLFVGLQKIVNALKQIKLIYKKNLKKPCDGNRDFFWFDFKIEAGVCGNSLDLTGDLSKKLEKIGVKTCVSLSNGILGSIELV